MKNLYRFWNAMQRLAGECDYARYCAHLRARHPARQLPTAKEFYLNRLEEKYARPSRCC